MPVVRSAGKRHDSEAAKRTLLERLVKEWSGESTNDGPVIFEVPTSRSGGIDVIVVWNDWYAQPLRDRSEIIHTAFERIQEQAEAKGRARRKTIMMAFGATVVEAIRNGLLPYTIQETEDMSHPFDQAKRDKIRLALLKQGAIPLSNGVALALPTREMALNALANLRKELPDVEWHFNQEGDD